MSLFTTIGEILNASSWYQLVKWPFWTLVIILAICGVYTARFGKRQLLCLGFQGALKLAIIYMIAAAGYIWAPSLMANLSQLPFFSVSEEALSLVNPLGLLERWDTALPRVLVRLYFLLFFINAASVFDYTNTPNFVGWLFFQLLFGGIAVVFYAALSSMVVRHWPGGPDMFCKMMAIILIAVFGLLLVFKFVFTFIIKNDSNAFQTVYMFLTTQKFGQQFTVTMLSFLIVLVYLVIASMNGHSRLELGSVNPVAFLVNGTMCVLTLYVFNRYYNV